jgi:transcriptional regulator with XRE-family HTH domain
MKVGDKIRDLRTLKKFSQENMAEMLDMSLGAYGDIERNKKDISLTRLEQIAKSLGVSVMDILSFGDKISNFLTNAMAQILMQEITQLKLITMTSKNYNTKTINYN